MLGSPGVNQVLATNLLVLDSGSAERARKSNEKIVAPE